MGVRKKFTFKDSEKTSRKDSYTVKPLDIVVDHSTNVRLDYGDDEEFQELKASIAENGLLQPVAVYLDQETGFLHLAHGFRRMKAVLELLDEKVVIERIPVFEMPNNEETILISHFVMNTGKKLTDLELGETLNKLTKLMGEDDFKTVSKRTGIEYVKVLRLVNFARKSSSKIKKLVKEKELSISTAIELVNNTNSVTHQNEAIDKAIEEKEKNGSKKITSKHIEVLITKSDAALNEDNSVINKLIRFVNVVKTTNNEDIDHDFTSRLEMLLNEIKKGELSDKEIMGKYFVKQITEA